MLNIALDIADPKVNKEIVVREGGGNTEGKNVFKYDKLP